MNNSAAHQRLVHDIMRRVGAWPDVRLWKQHTGTLLTPDGRAYVKVGIPGWGDIGGVFRTPACPHAHFFQVEAKTGSGALTKDQQNWSRICDALGICHVECRDPEELADVLLAHGARESE